MRLAGLTRVRNEEEVVGDLLDHMATFCNAVYVYDDESTDNTLDICQKHPIVHKVIKGNHKKDRWRAESQDRQELLEEAQKYVWDWFIYQDADERVEFEWKNFDPDYWEAVKFKLFDFYITPQDKDLNYQQRQFIGPEYRNILMMFRNYRWTKFGGIDAREPSLRSGRRCLTSGYVRHYGKAISVERYEAKCKYYVEEFGGSYAAKWKERMGGAVRTDYQSDFGTKLIKWQDRDKLGRPLIRNKSADQNLDPNTYLSGKSLVSEQKNQNTLVPGFTQTKK